MKVFWLDSLVTCSAFVHAAVLFILLHSSVGITCHEEVTVSVMLLVEMFHRLLLRCATPCSLGVVVGSKVGLRELGGVAVGVSGSLVMGPRQGLESSYDMVCSGRDKS